MATRQIKVVISVQDGATKKMKQVEKSVRDSGKAADDASKRFMHFKAISEEKSYYGVKFKTVLMAADMGDYPALSEQMQWLQMDMREAALWAIHVKKAS